MIGGARVGFALMGALLAALVTVPHASAQIAGGVLVVDRERVVAESEAARSLRAIEAELRDRAQRQLDAVKAALEAEEKELTRLRETLPKDEFEARSRDFDRRVRRERRAAQERGALLQDFIKEARDALASALGPVLQRMRAEKGALVIVDVSAAAAYDPSIDITNEAIGRFDAAVGQVTFTPPEALEAE